VAYRIMVLCHGSSALAVRTVQRWRRLIPTARVSERLCRLRWLAMSLSLWAGASRFGRWPRLLLSDALAPAGGARDLAWQRSEGA
jgi:hypothetical protein